MLLLSFIMLVYFVTVLGFPAFLVIYYNLKNYYIHMEPLFKPEDLWVGSYLDTNKNTLYVCILPTIGIKILFISKGAS